MPSPCAWCGTRHTCPDCTKAVALRGGAAACGVCVHLGFPCSKHRTHPLQGTDKAPEETAIEKIEESVPSIVAHFASEDSYSNKGCRCEQCRAAHRAYRMAQRRSRGVPEARRGRTHGSVGTYRVGCRCSLCREAAVAYQAEYAARRKGAGK